jgi:hypothetical protein
MDSNVNTGVQNYLNTLIFCLVAKGVSIVVLILLIKFPDWAYCFLTIEIIIIIIVVVSLLRVTSYEKTLSKARESLKAQPVTLANCPDFYTKEFDGQATQCHNTYNTPDGRYTYAIGTGSLDKINLDGISKSGLRTLEEVCDVIGNSGSDYMSTIAWTDIKPRCTTI